MIDRMIDLSEILDQPGNVSLEGFLAVCSRLGIGSSIDLPGLIRSTLAYVRNPEKASPQDRALATAIELGWYETLSRGVPDFSFYGSESYLAELWACWRIYSRSYLRMIRSFGPKGRSVVSDLGRVRTIVDLGCGHGYSSLGLRQLFPKARVTGTNLAGTAQARIATELGIVAGFDLVSTPREVGTRSVDLVFASEYFEHFQDPVGHLSEVIDELDPRAILVANSFGARAAGHFLHYTPGIGRPGKVPGTRIGRIFNSYLKGRGYKMIETNLWNQRPNYWRRA